MVAARCHGVLCLLSSRIFHDAAALSRAGCSGQIRNRP
jgi:hypothetical protein